MIFSDSDIAYMKRALDLARGGGGHVSPNPMVGAVIVAPDGRIIGEGWHRRFGGPHAEVNAVRSVTDADRHLFPEATMYVTLEPCSHYGKTPPCALLLKECGFARVVVACGDPNPKVAGRGIAILRDAGIRVDEGLLRDEAYALNRPFMTAHRLRRPYVVLKWAQSSDGFMDAVRTDENAGAYRFSTALTSQIVHRRRAMVDAIAVGARTVLADNPRLDVRLVEGRAPQPIVFDRHGLLRDVASPLLDRAIVIGDEKLDTVLHSLYSDHGITSLLVEGGASLLRSFIDVGLWDDAFVEVSPEKLGEKGVAKAPSLPGLPVGCEHIGDNMILHYEAPITH